MAEVNPDSLFVHAREVIPGGVSSPVRAYGSVGGTPVFVSSARGPYITGVDGREYVDLVCSWGPALLGHGHPEVVAAVQAAASRGLSFGAPTAAEVELADAVRARVPAAEQVRFVSTGTEATMTAIRLARGATGRDAIVKFAGCYHGHSDALLAAAGSGVATQGLPGSAGVTQAAAAEEAAEAPEEKTEDSTEAAASPDETAEESEEPVFHPPLESVAELVEKSVEANEPAPQPEPEPEPEPDDGRPKKSGWWQRRSFF